MENKMIIYQVLPRLFGNATEPCASNGTIEENGCGKLNYFTAKALKEIKKLGATHIWYTGLIEHATQTDYTAIGIKQDNPILVKGKAGSPYAIKDYYDIDPDLAVDPQKRMQEFETLVNRTHKAGLQMIIDFVPNHVARQYFSDARPEGIRDFGEDDNKSCAFSPNNNFYYIPNQKLTCNFAQGTFNVQPYEELPAKATGNDLFNAYPSTNDWYETVKLNYGIDYYGGYISKFNPIPNTWHKMLHILLYWASKKIDGFRCDMAEMVPCAFWHWAIHKVKKQYPDILFIAEVYNPSLYRDYLHRGGFDYLYDKVGLYDTLRSVTSGNASARSITECWQAVDDIQTCMLNFLENHDEQRIASDFFASNGASGKAALVVSACMNTNPFMVYAGQEYGERGMDAEGFSGRDGRTSIFDYWSVPTLRQQALGILSEEALSLSTYYKKVLCLQSKEKALSHGLFYDLMYVNQTDRTIFDGDRCYTFLRKYENELILITANFSHEPKDVTIKIPTHAFEFLKMQEGVFSATDLLTGKKESILLQKDGAYTTTVSSFDAKILKIILKKKETTERSKNKAALL
ncbi:MAG: alpha-amylase family glycosyl hydrolase [Bacteroidaceae bacterium]